MRRAGLFLAVLAVAVGKVLDPGGVLVDGDGGAQGCEPDEQLFMPPSGELQGLDLLQNEVRVQTGPAQRLLPAANEVAQPVVITKAANNKTDDQSLHSSLAKATATLHDGAHLLAGLMTGSALKTFGMGVAIIFIVFCGCFLFSRRRLQGDPSGQQLLQSPQSSYTRSPCASAIQTRASTRASLSTPQASPAQGHVGPMILPPICTSPMLPHTEARFMIPIEILKDIAGELDGRTVQFDIQAMSGRKIFRGTVSQTAQGQRCLGIASACSDEVPLVTVLAPPRGGSKKPQLTGHVSSHIGPMELYDKDRRFYGTLEPVPRLGAVLRCKGELVMSLEFGGSDLSMSASSMDGEILGVAGKNVVQSSMTWVGEDTWKVQVMPNLDAILVAACMLGALIFK